MVGSGQVQEPHKGCLGRFGTPVLVGQGAAKIDRHSEVQATPWGDYQGWPSTREESRGSLGKIFAVTTLEGQNPREAPVAVGLKRRAAARHSRQA